MTYTVNQVAKLSGVTVRTLHHYDEIGLLKPAYYGQNQYRYYGQEELLMLQQILFYRQLGLPLDDIRRILASSDFNKIAALHAHKKALQKKLDQTTELIETIDKTIKYLKGKVKMKDEELFYGIHSPRQKKYEKYLIERGMTTESEIRNSKVTDAQVKQFQREVETLYKAFAQAIENNLKPGSLEVQELVRRQYEALKLWYTPTQERFIGLTHLYNEHEDFQKFFAHFHPQLLPFLSEAMRLFAKRELI
jgi:DNA-binding transcriptional MerR regulator